ncbi:O-antigen ligase family protein [Deinococcus cellulosilyticus]|uniref:O-antigen ligase-related domain-containing protein n=1 Tax=Deinococcus cellulosilyticus (strain DSM 18568 / NBRC 106333 / KACC 11606 / 5516J-15) TaxID=1223518 RepID=A0A511N459_DEIC1|nr:O-antigen ligase family protein [Deinococcus cellulosilyticus]GEM47605.1 hypothetical protein DC3_32400 [Deinococcus cellulosilyticus NBRC 106333 = KACC 11606]
MNVLHGILSALALLFSLVAIFVAPLTLGGVEGWGAAVVIGVGGITLVLTALAVLTDPNPRVNFWWALPLLALLLWIWITVFQGSYRIEGFRWAALWTAILGTAFSVHYLGSRYVGLYLGSFLLSAVVVLVYAYLQTTGFELPLFKNVYSETSVQLITSTYYNPSHLSGYLLLVSAITTGLVVFRRPDFVTPIALIILVASQWINLKTDSSSIPIVIGMIPLTLVVWLGLRFPRTAPFLLVTGILALTGMGSFLFSSAGQAFYEQNKRTIGLTNTWQGFLKPRQHVWSYGIRVWQDHPIVGVGIGQFGVVSPNYRRDSSQTKTPIDQKYVNYTHNDILQIGSELGVVGVILFLLLLLASVLQKNHHRFLTGMAVVMVVGYLLTGIFDSHVTAIPSTMLAFYAFLGLAVPARQDSLTEDSGTISRNKLRTET